MSLDIEAHTGHHAHKTGHQRVDMVVALSALFISLVSLGVAILHGRTMESMANANARLVSANSWPFLTYSAGIETINGIPTLHMHVLNAGVGPAKIEAAELLWKGVSYRSDQDFLRACCAVDPASVHVDSDLLSNEVLRAGDRIPFLSIKHAEDAAPFVALQRAMLSCDLQLRVCYCSIFDECWQSDLATLSLKPTPVKACQQPKVPFDQGLLKGRS
ncbi:MAG TPA: hypothetical protein VN750_23805 [Steroidobacteraceae bacterium]|nr:hypothetical protein [Steroidobacteraceae bacterium]